MKTPIEESILKWEDPIELTEESRIKKVTDWSNPLARKKNPLPALEKLPALEEILDNIFPPRIIEFDGKKYLMCVLREETKREKLGDLE